jgi:hypothetical protein
MDLVEVYAHYSFSATQVATQPATQKMNEYRYPYQDKSFFWKNKRENEETQSTLKMIVASQCN